MRTKIVHVIAGLLTGGAEMSLCKLLRAMNHRRFEHAVVSLSEGDSPVGRRIRELGVPVFHTGLPSGRLPGPAGAVRLAKLIRGLHPDLLQGWMYHGNLAAMMVAPLLSARAPVIWNICHTQCDLRQEKPTTAMTMWLGARVSRWTSGILTDSAACASVHQRRLKYDSSRWTVIPNGFDLQLFAPSETARGEVRAELSLGPETLLVGLIGRYHPVKDHAGFLEAAALLRRSAPEAHFLLAGRGVGGNQVLLKRAAALGLTTAVHLMDERADVPRIAASLDIAVSSSYSESFPNVVGEAMSCGVPCVVTAVGDSAYLVGETGAVVPPKDPAALARACADLHQRGRVGRRALGMAARQRIAREFSIGAVAARYEELWDRTLEQKRLAAQGRCAA